MRLPLLVLLLAITAVAQNPDLAGEYVGQLGPMHVKLHLVSTDGKLAGTVDSPDQNMFGVPCADINLHGQALSFTVPMVRGTWAGVVSADGSSLTGTWNQGMAMPLNLTRVTPVKTAAASGTTQAPSDVTWDDYVFKFNAAATTAQVLEGGKLVGNIHTINGEQQVVPVPGAGAEKLTKSFADYKAFNARTHAGGGGATPTTAASSPPTVPTATAATAAPGTSPNLPSPASSAAAAADVSHNVSDIHFDDTAHTITVPRPEGIVVTFSGADVKIAGFRKSNYILKHKSGSVGRVLERSTMPGRSSTSLTGGGEEFLREGMGIIYDSGIGGSNYQESPQILLAKQLSQVAIDAVDAVRKVPGHEGFTPPGYKNLKEISQYRLRSDGSR